MVITINKEMVDQKIENTHDNYFLGDGSYNFNCSKADEYNTLC